MSAYPHDFFTEARRNKASPAGQKAVVRALLAVAAFICVWNARLLLSSGNAATLGEFGVWSVQMFRVLLRSRSHGVVLSQITSVRSETGRAVFLASREVCKSSKRWVDLDGRLFRSLEVWHNFEPNRANFKPQASAEARLGTRKSPGTPRFPAPQPARRLRHQQPEDFHQDIRADGALAPLAKKPFIGFRDVPSTERPSGPRS